jgi:adenylate kinase family enzyme
VGAAGWGPTTLGRALAERFGCPPLDTDDYFWLPTDPPFREIRDRAARQALLDADLRRHDAWVLPGSLCGWGDVFVPRFDLVVFLSLTPEVRLARLLARERERYGDEAIAPGGRLHGDHGRFMTWAAAYDDAELDMRSRKRHEAWLATLRCPVVRVTSDAPVDALVATIVAGALEHVSTASL